jgi:hypothetical protein
LAASGAAGAFLLAPRLVQSPAAPAARVADVPAAGADRMLPTPGSADLIALRAPAATPVAASPAREPEAATSAGALLASVPPSDRASPRPLDNPAGESPADFPLVDTGEARRWPRSEVVGASSDPAIEAYLVRHNQMLANDGLGGFVPYVDVVANGQPAAADDAAGEEGSAEGDGQE